MIKKTRNRQSRRAYVMSSRLRNILRRNGFESLEGLREYPKEHFIKFRNMGQATLQELY